MILEADLPYFIKSFGGDNHKKVQLDDIKNLVNMIDTFQELLKIKGNVNFEEISKFSEQLTNEREKQIDYSNN